MISRLTIKLKNEDGQKLNTDMSSLFQGVLMQYISQEYAEELHLSQMKPYSQFLDFTEDGDYWIINALNSRAREKLIAPLVKNLPDSFILRHNGMRITVLEKTVMEISYSELIEQSFLENQENYFKIRFIKPTAFKSDGEYVNFPSAEAVFKNLMKRYDIVNEGNEIYDEEVVQEVADRIKVVSYSLKSTFFSLEGVRIPSFVGYLAIRVKGPQQMANLVKLLLTFGTFSGIGIKTAVGMGHIELEERKNINAKTDV